MYHRLAPLLVADATIVQLDEYGGLRTHARVTCWTDSDALPRSSRR